MKTKISLLAIATLMASGAALACDDVGHRHVQASSDQEKAVVADKADTPQVAKKPVAKQKAPAKSIAQASAPRTAVN